MEEKLIEILGEKSKEITTKINEKIKLELKRATDSLIRDLPSKNRCEICTLHLPCSHSSKNTKLDYSFEYKPPLKLNYWKLQNRELSIPSTDLKTLEKIEDFREKKIKLDLEEIKKLKDAEISEDLEKKIKEEKRIKYATKQKIKLEKYKEDIKERKKIIAMQIKENSERQKREDLKFRHYLDLQKKKLMEKFEKNKCSENFFKSVSTG